tara:strand:- start:227 stop:535 length:309 start_codon:yes stop_codon:yes gene_type:complete
MKLTNKQIKQIIREEIDFVMKEKRKRATRPLTKDYTATELLNYHDLQPREKDPFTEEDGVKYFHGIYKKKFPLTFKGHKFGDQVLYKLVKLPDELINLGEIK